MKICLNCRCLFDKDNWLCLSCGNKPIQQDGILIFSPELSEGNDGFDASYFDQLALVEAQSFWFCARNRLLTWALHKYFPSIRNFFEIGCGTGFVLSAIGKEFPDLDLYGGEIFSKGLSFIHKHVPRANLMQIDARRIPFRNEFDVIGAFDVLEHIKEDEIVLQQMYQALKPKGGIILTVPQHPFLWSQVDEYSYHVRRYNAQKLKFKIESSGFEVIRMTSFVSLLLPIVMLSRLRWKKSRKKYDSMSEYKIGTVLNVVLEKVLDFENFMIKRGVRFPLGSSLLLVASKNENVYEKNIF